MKAKGFRESCSWHFNDASQKLENDIKIKFQTKILNNKKVCKTNRIKFGSRDVNGMQDKRFCFLAFDTFDWLTSPARKKQYLSIGKNKA